MQTFPTVACNQIIIIAILSYYSKQIFNSSIITGKDYSPVNFYGILQIPRFTKDLYRGKQYRECAPLAKFTLHDNLSPMSLDDVLYNGESETCATRIPASSLINHVESFKKPV